MIANMTRRMLLAPPRFLWRVLTTGYFDNDPATTIWDELLLAVGVVRGPWGKTINSVLKLHGGINPITRRANYQVYGHKQRSDGDTWMIRKGPGADSNTVLALADEIEEALSRRTKRHVAVLAKPLMVLLYYTEPRPVYLRDWGDWLANIPDFPENRFACAPAISWDGNEEQATGWCMEEERFAHLLVAGITGSGKTELLKAILATLCLFNDPEHLAILLIDPKGMDFAGTEWATLPHLVSKPIVDLSEAGKAIHRVREELDRRMAVGDKSVKDKGIFIICDELASLANHRKVIEDLTHIARLGRAWRVQLIMATQRPTSRSIDTTLRSQLTCNITGAVTSPEEAKYATGHAESGAERLPGKGAFVLNAPGYHNYRLQGFLTVGCERMPGRLLDYYEGMTPHWGLEPAKPLRETYVAAAPVVTAEPVEGEHSPEKGSIVGSIVGEPKTTPPVAKSIPKGEHSREPSILPAAKTLPPPEPGCMLPADAPRIATSRGSLMRCLLADPTITASAARKLHTELYGKGLDNKTAEKLVAYAGKIRGA